MKGEDERKHSSLNNIWAAIAALFIYGLAISAVNVWLTVNVQHHKEKFERQEGINKLNEERIQDNEETIQILTRTVDLKVAIIEAMTEQDMPILPVNKTEARREVLNPGSSNIADLLKQGIRGPPGRDGKDGKDGRDGLPGVPGRDGRDSINLVQVERHINSSVTQAVQSEMVKVTKAVRSIPKVSGAVYIRWGRTSCSSTSMLVMKGIAAGTHFSLQGGSSQYICISDDPEYHQLAAKPAHYGLLSGVEYENPVNVIFGKSLHDHNAPCSFCQTEDRAQQIMIPGRMRCSTGWTLEYQGYLMSDSNSWQHHHRTEYVCVDKDAEAIPGLAHDTNGALWYHVVANCTNGFGHLGYCPPYKTDLPISCVVCSK